jgi:membrane-bound lytic murein transglycosylase D
MFDKRLLLVAVVLGSAGCLSTTPPPPRRPSPPVAQAIHLDASELRTELEHAYEKIVQRSSGSSTEVVDADASLSMPVPDHRSVRGAINLFSIDLHDKIQASFLRSARYKKLIDSTLDAYHLPRGLAYLPVIESAYSPTLTSRAGARGIWQFMPTTAREYGLRVDWWVDERADPEKSTRAAAQYLRDLYQRFGDWSLVLAAYNAGPGRIERALANTGSKSFWELEDEAALPAETRGYVPTFYATIVIASDPSTYGFRLIDPDSIECEETPVEGPVSLRYIAQVSGVDETLVTELNPELRRGIVPPERIKVKLPKGAVEKIATRAATLRFEDPNLGIASFTARPGDTLASLAKKLRLSREEIAWMNGVDHLRAGKAIYLPISQTEVSLRLKKAAANSYHIVRRGETLFSIAKKHGISVEELVDLNRFGRKHVLHPGERLLVATGSTMTSGM